MYRPWAAVVTVTRWRVWRHQSVVPQFVELALLLISPWHYCVKLSKSWHYCVELSKSWHYCIKLSKSWHYCVELSKSWHYCVELSKSWHYCVELSKYWHYCVELSKYWHYCVTSSFVIESEWPFMPHQQMVRHALLVVSSTLTINMFCAKQNRIIIFKIYFYLI